MENKQEYSKKTLNFDQTLCCCQHFTMVNMAALRIFSYLTLGQVLLYTISRCLNFSFLIYRAMKMAISNGIFEETKGYSKIVLTSAT